MSLVKFLGAVGGIIPIKTHLKDDLGFSGFLDLTFLFIEEIWHEVQKGSRYIISYISSQTLSVSPANNYLVDLWPHLWCNWSRSIFCVYGNFFVFDISLISPKNACFLCSLCGNVTALTLFFWCKQYKALFGINNYFPNSIM